MAYIKFTDKGYDYIENNEILFSTDDTHHYLFNYIASDLSDLPKLFEQYVSNKLNVTTFELIECEINIDELNRIKEILISAHPYYKYAYKKVILNAIGNYFNNLLVYSNCAQNLSYDYTLSEPWYYSKLRHLISHPIVTGEFPLGCSPLDFYYKYKKRVDCHCYEETPNDWEFLVEAPSEIPGAFSSEISLKDWTHSLLQCVSDQDAKGAKKITLSQRIELYENEYSQWGLKLRNFPESLNTNTKYEVKDFHELLSLEIISMIQSSTIIKKCENCGKYFMCNNFKKKYCDRNESGKSCAKEAKKRLNQKRYVDKPECKLHDGAYRANSYRCKNGTISQEVFYIWSSISSAKRDQVTAGKMTLSDYKIWIDEHKKIKNLRKLSKEKTH